MKFSLNKGFTLIELMVVISVISLLSSTVLVSLQSARIKGYNAKYSAEVRALHTALLIYRDTNGSYPACPNNDPDGMGYVCGDWYNFQDLDIGLSVLVSGGYIGSIPHYYSYPQPAGNFSDYKNGLLPVAATSYLPNYTDPVTGGTFEVHCGELDFADWVPGTSEGVMLVMSNQPLQIKSAGQTITTCNLSPIPNCVTNPTPTTSGHSAGVSYWCLPLDYF